MNLRRIALLVWLALWSCAGLTVVGLQFGPEYGVVYCFTVFPAAMFIDIIKEDRARRRVMSGFVMGIGLLGGYCAFAQVKDSYPSLFSGFLGGVAALLLHLLFERFLRALSIQVQNT